MNSQQRLLKEAWAKILSESPHPFFDYSGFNSNLVHLCDLEYWTRIGSHEGVAYIPEPLNGFRVHSRSASAYNHHTKAVEVSYLDRLVLFHDYLFHPFTEI